MQRLFVPLVAVLVTAPVVVGPGTASATGLTACTASANRSEVYDGGGGTGSATFTIDWSATETTPAEFYFHVTDSNGHSKTSVQHSTNTFTSSTMSYSLLLSFATNDTLWVVAAPLEVDFVVSNSSTLGGGPAVCQTSVTLMPNVEPTEPTGVTATAGNTTALVEWTDSDGFDGLTYVVTSSPGDFTCSVDYPETSCTVSGLTNGTEYTFTVTSESIGGLSDDSAPSAPVTPSAGDDGPTDPGPTGPGLPATGANAVGLLVAALLAMAGGAALLRAGRRRRTA